MDLACRYLNILYIFRCTAKRSGNGRDCCRHDSPILSLLKLQSCTWCAVSSADFLGDLSSVHPRILHQFFETLSEVCTQKIFCWQSRIIFAFSAVTGDPMKTPANGVLLEGWKAVNTDGPPTIAPVPWYPQTALGSSFCSPAALTLCFAARCYPCPLGVVRTGVAAVHSQEFAWC